MIQRLFFFDSKSRTENSVYNAVTDRFSFSSFQIRFKNFSVFHRHRFCMQFFDCFCKMGTHFSGRFPLFKRNPGCSEDFFQLIQSVCIILICQFPRKANCQQIGISKCETQFFMNIFCRCFLIADASLLDVSFQSLRVRIASDREKCVIYLQ